MNILKKKTKNMITEFRGKNKWLSNFAIVNVELDGVVYPSVEHAYASAKSTDPMWKSICSDTSNSPAYIKRKGRKVQLISIGMILRKI